MGDTLKLNNKGFAISSIMYIILVLAVILISLILVTLSSRKLILDKLGEEVLTTINDAPKITYRQTLQQLKSEIIAYMDDKSLTKESIKIENLDSSIDSEVLEKYKLNDKYLTAVQNTDLYNVYLGKEKTITNTTELPKNTIDVVDYKIYGNSVQLLLPEEYQQVEYIESTGTQYIDTGYVVQEDDELELDYKITQLSQEGDKMLFGSKRDISGGGIWVETYGSVNKWYVRFGQTTSTSLESVSSQYEGTLKIKKNEFIINGTKVLSLSFDSMPTTSLELFGRTNESEVLMGSYVQIRNFKITRNSEIIRQFIPCYRKSDNVIGMYEIIENKFYTNQGTGTFLKGNNAPTLYAPIEVESVGNKSENILDSPGFAASGTAGLTNSYGTTLSTAEFTNSLTVTQSQTPYPDEPYRYQNGFFVMGINNPEGDYVLSFDIDIKDNPLNATHISIFNQGGGTAVNDQTIPLPSSGKGRVSVNLKYRYHPTNTSSRTLEIRCMGMSFTMSNITLTHDENVIPITTSSKNLFNKDNLELSKKWNNKSIQSTDTGVVIIPSTIGNESGSTQGYGILKLGLASEYAGKTITLTSPVCYSDATKLVILDSSKAIIKQGNYFALKDGLYYSSITIEDNIYTDEILGLRLYYKTEDTSITEFEYKDIMVTEGSDIVHYEPYVEPITTNVYLNESLRKIDSYVDHIDFKNNKVVRNIKERAFTGEENWSIYDRNTDIERLMLSSTDMLKGSSGFSNVCLIDSGAWVKKTFVGQFDSNGIIRFYRPFYTGTLVSSEISHEAWKSFLKERYNVNNPVKVNYVLATSIEQEIELPRINTNLGATQISINTDLEPSSYEFTILEKIIEI